MSATNPDKLAGFQEKEMLVMFTFGVKRKVVEWETNK